MVANLVLCNSWGLKKQPYLFFPKLHMNWEVFMCPLVSSSSSPSWTLMAVFIFSLVTCILCVCRGGLIWSLLKERVCSGSEVFPLFHSVVVCHFEMMLWFLHPIPAPWTLLAILFFPDALWGSLLHHHSCFHFILYLRVWGQNFICRT